MLIRTQLYRVATAGSQTRNGRTIRRAISLAGLHRITANNYVVRGNYAVPKKSALIMHQQTMLAV